MKVKVSIETKNLMNISIWKNRNHASYYPVFEAAQIALYLNRKAYFKRSTFHPLFPSCVYIYE